ncbi:MAG: hypothetical protein H6810_11035 [Phycisphaeraceae bacterium]|nr:MAG: hypothetical protein H6810_11035 [Phycisphaeraceae bacterium]
MVSRTVGLALVGLLAGTAAAELTLPPVFGNHMVVQRDQPIALWGAADPGAEVQLQMGDGKAEARADAKGNWIAHLPALPSGGPYRIEISSGGDEVHFSDVLVGDVWICSGQSNMYFRVEQSARGEEFLAKPVDDQLRLLQVNKVWSRTPSDRVDTIGWRYSDRDHARKFTAVGYYFGRILQEETGVPIGLIHSSWGGTPLEAWTPLPTLEARPDVYADRLASLKLYDMGPDEAKEVVDAAQAEHVAFIEQAWKRDVGLDDGWEKPTYNDSAWHELELPGYFDGVLGSMNGIVWFRKTIDLAKSWNGQTATLNLGRIDDYDHTYVNGVEVGVTDVDAGVGMKIERHYQIPAGVLHEGENVVAIALMDVRSAGGVTPDGLPFDLVAGDETVPLGGLWRFAVGFDADSYGGFPLPGDYAVPVGRVFRRPAVLYNAMIHPLTRLGVRGVIWYQGESNAGRGDEYAQMFPDMINAWRDAWAGARGGDRDMPFYFVQLPNYRQSRSQPSESTWAEIREAQRLTEATADHTGMAITIDLGDPSNIHPTNKLPVAQRLARMALHDVYGEEVGLRTGPHPVSARVVGDAIEITFDNADGLGAKGGHVSGFELASDSGGFYRAEGEVEGHKVVVRCTEVKKPTRVRYAWADNPVCNLQNSADLPATPFQLTVLDGAQTRTTGD